jgi:hypothetical protein
MIEFTHKGFLYRTNVDASLVEGKDGASWNRTGSLAVRAAAVAMLRADKKFPLYAGRADDLLKQRDEPTPAALAVSQNLYNRVEATVRMLSTWDAARGVVRSRAQYLAAMSVLLAERG